MCARHSIAATRENSSSRCNFTTPCRRSTNNKRASIFSYGEAESLHRRIFARASHPNSFERNIFCHGYCGRVRLFQLWSTWDVPLARGLDKRSLGPVHLYPQQTDRQSMVGGLSADFGRARFL